MPFCIYNKPISNVIYIVYYMLYNIYTYILYVYIILYIISLRKHLDGHDAGGREAHLVSLRHFKNLRKGFYVVSDLGRGDLGLPAMIGASKSSAST